MLPNPFRLGSLPASAKLLLTLFLLLIGTGYLAALGNLYHQHSLADGKEGLTIDDLRVTFCGMEAPLNGDSAAQSSTPKSRMLEMIEPGGEMRENLIEGGPQAVRALESWLKRGALETEFTRPGLVQDGDPTAQEVLANNCLLCHNAEDGEKADAPYGPDLFTIDYQMVYTFAAPGTAKLETAGETAGVKSIAPQSISHLFLITHIHMLSIPVFTLIVSSLFLFTDLKPSLKGVLAPIPMLSLVCDFSSWWLARHSDLFLYLIMAAGAVFGVVIALQLLTVVASIWLGPRAADRAGSSA